ncbi:uncharacterized protein LOC130806224 [Amaranthus tricolor]|uniref:uncharacterized protein LOC130806224 n=1 Tax=Amaranthus tricolor TaxID=29722 RepID=UPI00258BDA91|nr:uncharacterized protein LOC130806224 [Amaranthus tricolor]
MGNCQAVDAAALVIQHPNGKVERMYWPITANEVMKMNPGHYVSLIIPISMSDEEAGPTSGDMKRTVRYTRVKLLRPTDTLVLGRAYRLVTSQEVKKVLMAKKLAKEKMNQKGSGSSDNMQTSEVKGDESENNDQESDQDKQRLVSRSMSSRSKTWRPSLQSISEAMS